MNSQIESAHPSGTPTLRMPSSKRRVVVGTVALSGLGKALRNRRILEHGGSTAPSRQVEVTGVLADANPDQRNRTVVADHMVVAGRTTGK